MVFANTIAYKLYRVTVGKKDITDAYPSQEEKKEAYEFFEKWGLRKEHLKNIEFRSLNESVPEGSIMLAQLLKKQEARKKIVEFLLKNVHGEEVQTPDVYIWEQNIPYGMDVPGLITLYEDDEYLVRVGRIKDSHRHVFMRIMRKQ